MIEYPKIETLFDRNPDNMKEIILGKWRLPEFEMLRDAPIWHVTEKIDGTNIRVSLEEDMHPLFEIIEPVVRLNGRTNNAQMSPQLIEFLTEAFPIKRFVNAVNYETSRTPVTVYGEAYGPKIQSGGWYRSDFGFRIFDVRIGDWWLNWDNVQDIANKLHVGTAPVLASSVNITQALEWVQDYSGVAALEGGDQDRYHEGIIARTDPILLMRNGQRLMWKMKVRDLPA